MNAVRETKSLMLVSLQLQLQQQRRQQSEDKVRVREERTAPVDAALKLLITCSRKTSGEETREKRRPPSSNYHRN